MEKGLGVRDIEGILMIASLCRRDIVRYGVFYKHNIGLFYHEGVYAREDVHWGVIDL